MYVFKNKFVKYIYIGKAPYFLLPDTLTDFKKRHKRKFWYNLRWQEKKLREELGDLRFEILYDEKKLSKFLIKVFELFKERWKDEYTSSAWKRWDGFKKYADAMIELAKQKKAFLAVLYSGEFLLSFAYCLVENNIVYLYQQCSTRDKKIAKYSPGKILFWKLFEQLIEQGYKKFDFMLGERYYKMEWATGCEEIFFKIEGDRNIKGYLSVWVKFLFYKTKFF